MVLPLCLLQYEFHMSFIKNLLGLLPFGKHSTTSTERIHQRQVLSLHRWLVLDVDISFTKRLKQLILEFLSSFGLFELNRLFPLLAHLLLRSTASTAASVSCWCSFVFHAKEMNGYCNIICFSTYQIIEVIFFLFQLRLFAPAELHLFKFNGVIGKYSGFD